MEPPSAYVKGVVAMIVLTELFRISDLFVNWGFLSTAPGYVSFFHYDVLYVVAGAILSALSLPSVRIGILTGLGYSLSGILLTLFDPDFPHFVRDPLGYVLGMELPVSLVFTVGSIALVLMLVTALRGYMSLRRAEPVSVV